METMTGKQEYTTRKRLKIKKGTQMGSPYIY